MIDWWFTNAICPYCKHRLIQANRGPTGCINEKCPGESKEEAKERKRMYRELYEKCRKLFKRGLTRDDI